MAKAVVRLAGHPRNTTVVVAPAIALKLGKFAAPNLMAAMMNGFMDVWSVRAEPGEDTSGAIFDPPPGASGSDGGRRDPHRGRKAAAAGAMALGLASLGTWLWRRRR